MNKELGLFILLGLAIGASFGVFIGAAMENTFLGIALGAIGLFLGWFIAAAILENEKSKKRK